MTLQPPRRASAARARGAVRPLELLQELHVPGRIRPLALALKGIDRLGGLMSRA